MEKFYCPNPWETLSDMCGDFPGNLYDSGNYSQRWEKKKEIVWEHEQEPTEWPSPDGLRFPD